MADFASNFQSLKLQFPFLEFDPTMEQLLGQFPNPTMEFPGFAGSECLNSIYSTYSQTSEYQGSFTNSFPCGVLQESNFSVTNKPLMQSVSVTTTATATKNHCDEKEYSMKKRKTADISEASSGVSSASSPTSAKNNKKGKKVKIGSSEEMPKDVVHVRARRGQATDSHSLAERVRRGKINERLKCLQDIVPGCYNKTMGMAVMLDEIINYVQSLQNQVEFLSMRLSAASTFHDFNIESDTMEALQREKVLEMEKLIKDVNGRLAWFQ